MHEQDLARQRVAVGVQAAGEQADDLIARFDVLGRDHPLALDHANGEAGQVEVVFAVEVGHLRRLAAEQGTARRLAAGRDAGDELGDEVRLELVNRDVVEEEERLGAAAEQVVDAHRDQVDAHGVVAFGLDRDQQLAADAVRTTHEHGLTVVACEEALVVIEPEEAGERTVAWQYARAIGSPNDRPNQLLHAVGGVQVNAGGAIGERLLAGCGLGLFHTLRLTRNRGVSPLRRVWEAVCGGLTSGG